MDKTDDLAKSMRDDLAEALAMDDDRARNEKLAALAVSAFVLAYADSGGEGTAMEAASSFSAALRPAFGLLIADGSDSQADRMSRAIAHAALNAAALEVGGDGTRLEWRTMRDDRVRDLHRPLDGEVRAAGTTFDVGGYELQYPGQPVGPPEVWINCRCTLVPAPIVAAAADSPSGVVVVARPSDSSAVSVEGGLPPDELHVTLGYYGDAAALDPEVSRLIEAWCTQRGIDAEAKVGGVARMGNDDPQAVALLLESSALADLRSSLEEVAAPDASHPHFTPHMTLGYGIDLPDTVPDNVHLGRVELWRGEERIGGDMAQTIASATVDPALVAVSDKPWSDFSASDYTIEQWRRACLLKMPGGDPDSKGTYKLPVREPSGALNRNGVHAAASALAGGRGGVDAPAEVKATARRKLRALYSQLGEDPPDSLKAASDTAVVRESLDDAIGSSNDSVVAAGPVNTHDAPGWLTNPRETQRLRDYWAKGEGAAKIRWGQPGDFDRCRKQLRKYVQNPEHLAGTCANLHYVALGFWPNQGPHAGKHRGGKRGLPGDGACTDCENFDPDNTTPEGAAVTAAFAATAELDDAAPPREWFADPGFEGPTALTATDDGEVLGHIALWSSCHTGFADSCVPPPHSTRDYHHFRTGYVQTAAGDVAVGNLTLGTGHADKGLSATAAVEHYDNTGAAVADVAAGEDEHGIWVHGMLRPGVTREQVHALRAGTVSGDWRTLGGKYELVAALIVNVPGFPIPRATETLAASGHGLSLLAAGMVVTDPNALDVERFAIAVVNRLAENERRAANAARVAALRTSLNGERVRELVAAIGDHS